MSVRGEGTRHKWLLSQVSYDGDDCLLWPFPSRVRGYGNYGHLGQMRYAHRTMCELVHGAPPTPGHQAAHECGNRLCVNPRHLSWKTNQQNQSDRRRHGTHLGAKGNRATISAAQIYEIRRLKGIETQDSIASRMGIARGCVQYWQRTTHDPKPPGTSRGALDKRRKKQQSAA